MTAEIAHWQDHASCAGLDPRWWFPEQGESTAQAVAICSTCEVRAACLEFGMSERFGIYGGLTARQRQKIRQAKHRKVRTVTHATPSGYAWHLNRHEKACWACADANSRYQEVSAQLRQEQK